MQDVAISSQTSSRNFVLIAGLLLYCGGFAILLGNPKFRARCRCRCARGLRNCVAAHCVVTTRRAVPLSISVRSGVPELIVLIAYVVAVSVYLIGGPQWIDQHLPAGWTNSQQINSSLRWRKSCSFSLLFRLRFFDSVSVIDFAILGFSDRACVRSVEVTCLSFSL